MGKENNINDKENQDEIQSNNNENDEQSKKVSEEFKKEVQSIIEKNLDNFVSINKIIKEVSEATKQYLPKYKDPKDIVSTISEIATAKPSYASYIVGGFTRCCIEKGQEIENIGEVISEIVKNKSNDALYYIVGGFGLGCTSAGKDLTNISDATKISNVISTIIQTSGIKNNSDVVSKIIDTFTQGCILIKKDLKGIDNVIAGIIKTDGIKNDQDLAFNITSSFVECCFKQKPDNIGDIAKSFSNLLNKINKDNFGENEQAIKKKLKPIFLLIVSRYFINTLTNSSNKQSSEDNKKTEEQLSGDNKKETDTEEQLCTCFNELFHEENNGKIKSFKDIPLEELLELQDKYLKERFKSKGVDSGTEYEAFLKMACNLIPKPEGNREPNVADLENNKNIFKDLKFIHLNNNDNIKSKKDLFEKIGLEPEDFGTKRGSEDSDFSIVHCSYLKHGFIMIIDKTKGYDDAIKQETRSIHLIDSSQNIQNKKMFFPSLLGDKQNFFDSILTLNSFDYQNQKNGTCWLNTMSAIGFLLKKQQECIAEQKQKQQKQVEQTEQQEQQPRESYGLSIDDILGGFSGEQNDSFVQGICDYSTEHFYPLTDISKKERDIIKRILAEQVKQNKANQKTLSTTSSQLEKSKEEKCKTDREKMIKLFNESNDEKNFIIRCIYLIESLERFTQNEKKLEELCNKFNINYTTLLEPEQEEDLDSEQQSTDSCFEEDTEKLEEPHNKSNIKDNQSSEPKRKKDSSNKKRKYDPLSECSSDDEEDPKNLENTKKSNSCCTIC